MASESRVRATNTDVCVTLTETWFCWCCFCAADLVLSPTQSVVLTHIKPEYKPKIEALMDEHGILPIEQVDPLTRLAMACPALPLCGLAVGEAERYMPTMIKRVGTLLERMGLGGEEILMRMTGCPNGCARPYMAELAFVGDGKDSYEVWVGGSPVLTNVGFAYTQRAKVDDDFFVLSNS